MNTIYTLSNCDTCKKALKWLAENELVFENHDIRKDGIGTDIVLAAIKQLGWEKVLNRRSTTWRNLDECEKQGVDAAKAAALIGENPTLMKRPLFVVGDQYWVGFDDKVRARLMR